MIQEKNPLVSNLSISYNLSCPKGLHVWPIKMLPFQVSVCPPWVKTNKKSTFLERNCYCYMEVTQISIGLHVTKNRDSGLIQVFRWSFVVFGLSELVNK